jgi:hypothetical protein
VFDVDIHLIQQLNGVAQHYHYDIRFLCQSDDSEPLRVSDESHAIRWLTADELVALTQEESILRLLRKSRIF